MVGESNSVSPLRLSHQGFKDACKCSSKNDKNRDKVYAIIGANGSGINIATASSRKSSRCLWKSATVSTNPIVTVDNDGKVRPYSFRILLHGSLSRERCFAYFAASEMGKERLPFFMTWATEYSQGLRQFFY